MISSLLIANRGEIACRIIRTARRMGIRTIAVFSDADADALHVRQADSAIHVGASPASESYLQGKRIIAAAIETGADAIHPGYGFLSENADFAQAVIDAGLIWVGPRPDSIRAMGLKDAAKQLMRDAGVPVTPGYDGTDQSYARLEAEADATGYPVLIKAVAGGGGKGMRRVDDPADFAEALASCRREAQTSFGNDVVLVEKYIQSPRHIEVQVFGDAHGNVVHLFERDCSLQRRHQKVIEEAPAPGMDEATRERLCAAAVRAARAVNYVSAGTVEFIADGSGPLSAERIWFMEMNTRLQVEHPVTEEITGIDLVEWQLSVASGEALPLSQNNITITGHAIEARLYAEDPARMFLPSTGPCDVLHFAEPCDQPGAGRIESGVEQGDAVTAFYDPMIAKVIAHATDRNAAIQRLSAMLSHTAVWPVKTNAGFLVNALAHPDFVSGTPDTGLIARSEEWLCALPEIPAKSLSDAAARLARPDPIEGFRLNAAPRRKHWFMVDGEPVEIDLGQLRATGPGSSEFITHAGRTAALKPWRADPLSIGTISDGMILAPMPGTVTIVDISEGDHVKAGQRLIVLEAMKMEHALNAPFDGHVTQLAVSIGSQVQVDALLAQVGNTDNSKTERS